MTKDGMIKYVLADFLEMHYSNDPRTLKKIKTKLLNGSSRDVKLHPAPAVTLNDMLVAVQGNIRSKATQLVVLNPRRQSFRTYQLKEKNTEKVRVARHS